MDRRTHESPMEFTWTNGKGPVDQDSPFITALPQNGNSQHSGSNNGLHGKRSRSAFESPIKSQPSSSFPSLRPAAGQRTLFSNIPPRPASPQKPLPATPAPDLDSLFRTPRKPLDEFFSSGGETPNSIDNNADSEATPDQTMAWAPSNPTLRSRSPVKDEKKAASPKKKRESLWGKMWNSPSRLKMLDNYSKGAENRVVKRRNRNNKASTRKSNSYDSESDGGRAVSRRGRRGDGDKGPINSDKPDGPVATFLKLVEGHPNAPKILLLYLQLFGNFLMFCFGAYIIYSFYSAILSNVDKDVEEKAAVTILEIARCSSDWEAMNCQRGIERSRSLCEELGRCMSRDPKRVARAQVSAKTFARILNDFVEPISFKAMAFYLVGFGIFAFSFNAALSYMRNTVAHDQAAYHPPPTPQRHPSGAMYPPSTPYGNHYYYAVEPGPSAMAGAEQRRIELG